MAFEFPTEEAASLLRQFLMWGVMMDVARTAAAPFFQALSNTVNPVHPNVPMSPADAASAVVRRFIDHDAGVHTAAESGVGGSTFDTLVALAGDALAPDELAVALRRKLIDESGTGAGSTSFEQGIAEGRLADKWGPIVKELAHQYPSPSDILDAYLEGQIEEGQAKDLFAQMGGAPAFFDLLFNTRGSAPSPVEAGTMANRGIIPWDEPTGAGAVSFKQAFLEGPWRNKWEEPMRKLAEYLPPPRTVTALQRSGAITADQAKALYQQAGLSPDLAAAYVADASSTKVAATKDLAESTVVDLYKAQVISEADAKTMLGALGYSDSETGFLLAYADLSRALAAVNSAVTRIGTLYVSHKLGKADTLSALATLGLPSGQVDQLIQTWDLEAANNVKLLSESQVVDAWFYKVLSQAEAVQELTYLGYAPHDAWTLLSIKNKAPLPDEPAPGPAPVPLLP